MQRGPNHSLVNYSARKSGIENYGTYSKTSDTSTVLINFALFFQLASPAAEWTIIKWITTVFTETISWSPARAASSDKTNSPRRNLNSKHSADKKRECFMFLGTTFHRNRYYLKKTTLLSVKRVVKLGTHSSHWSFIELPTRGTFWTWNHRWTGPNMSHKMQGDDEVKLVDNKVRFWSYTLHNLI